MMLYPVVKAAAVLGGIGILGVLLANLRRAWMWLPGLLGALIAAGFAMQVLDVDFVVESIAVDAPWRLGLVLAAWTAFGASGAIRVTSWPAVVLATALVGDVAVATGLALAEPDPARRARLVVAANGASLIGPASSATTLALGVGGWATAGLGLVLALFGLVGGRGAHAVQRPDARAAWGPALTVALCVPLVWGMAVGNAIEFIGFGLENLPPLQPGHATPTVGLVAVIAGAIGFEPAVALVAEHALALASALRGPWAADAIRLGVAVGSGLPALVASGSKLTVGLPLWVAQVLAAIAFLAVTSHV